MFSTMDPTLIITSDLQRPFNGSATDSSTKSAVVATPKRPLSAYNIYFQLERTRLINGESERAFTMNDAIKLCDEKRIIRSQPQPKRKHRKTHGKLSFQQMARIIADSWKALDGNHRQIFEDCAEMEKERYMKEKKELNATTAAQSDELEVRVHATPIAGAIAKEVSVKGHGLSVSNWIIPVVEHEGLVSEAVPPSPYVAAWNDLTMDESEPIEYIAQVQEDEQDEFEAHQNLLYNLKIINERQACLQRMEQSLKSMVQRHQKLQQLRNERRRKSILDSREAPKLGQVNRIDSMFQESPMTKNEGFLNKIPMKMDSIGSNYFDLNASFDYSFDGMVGTDDSVFDAADDVFNKAESTIFSSFHKQPPKTRTLGRYIR